MRHSQIAGSVCGERGVLGRLSVSHARPCGDSCLLGSLEKSELASAFFGDVVTESVFSGKIRWRICFSLCPWKQMRRVKLRSVELRL